MADLLRQAVDWLGAQRLAHLSHAVRYQRGDESVEVAVTVGRTVFELTDSSGVMERWESRDFLIAAADLVLAGEAIKPRSGDRIADGDVVFEVMAQGKEPCWRWSDPYGQTMRIHTKQVAQE